jgi:NADH-quinone oxidoreductase subunit M
MVVAAIGTVLAAGYLLWLYQRTAFGEPTEHFAHERIADVHVTEWIAWLPMLIAIVVFGIYPNLLFDVTDETVTGIANGVAAAIGAG